MKARLLQSVTLFTIVSLSAVSFSGCKKMFEHQVTPTFSSHSEVFDIDSNSVDTTNLKLYKLTKPFSINIDSVLDANKVDVSNINSLVVTGARIVIKDSNAKPYTSNLFKTVEGYLRTSATSTSGELQFLGDYDISRNNETQFDINKKDDGFDVKTYIDGANTHLYLTGLLNENIKHKFQIAVTINYKLDGKSTKIGR